MRAARMAHQLVETVPDELAEGVLYVSMPYGSVLHKCACGCGRQVVTPLGRTDWKLIYDGESISLYPSIGNWQFPCRSHYWIKRNVVVWAGDMSDAQVKGGRARDRAAKAKTYGQHSLPDVATQEPTATPGGGMRARIAGWRRKWRRR